MGVVHYPVRRIGCPEDVAIMQVTIVMQPLKELPLANQAPKDKFLIQGVKIGGGGPAPDLKAVFDDVDKSEIVDQRLVCTFEFPADRPLATVQEVSPLKPVAGYTARPSGL